MFQKNSKTKLFLCILISLFWLTGCADPEVIDEISIMTGIGYDLDENKIKGTALYPSYLPEGTVENVTITATNDIARKVIIEMQRKSPNPLVTGSLEVVIFGKEFATEMGIFRIVDSLQRDPSVGARLYLIVSDGTAAEILNEQLGGEGTGEYLSSLIDHNIRVRDLPETNLHLFAFSYHQEGRDPYLPIMKRIGEKDITISGVAIFKKDKVIYEIPEDKMLYFKLLVDKYSKGSVSARNEEQESTMRVVDSNTNYIIEKKNGVVDKILIQIKIEAIVLEYSGKRLTQKEVEKLEKDFSDYIKRECTELLKTFQELKVDPAGIGREVKSVTYGFDIKKWEESQYPNVEITVEPDVTISETGVVE
ncbi:spore germination protein [Bacillus oleivorans]|uniref:Spore germination protein n=1 Tax=Bacillus oleivorans TaxID=1448271 RepID=A0A285CYF1_9BACI|nr:Ger(x)C family spore germination protein [Bacillus oleivorans]SNX72435.1 spore germination protein [Bacillus oleivorans]